MARLSIDVPLNRVEGDLALQVAVEDGVVVDAWSAGTMFRGFENLLVGRAAMDALVLTPRICGMCSGAHLVAAVRALDDVAGVAPTASGQRIRDVALAAERVQSDLRQTILMFAVDLVSPRYAAEPLHAEAVRRYRPFAGDAVVAAVRATKHVLEIVAILGGQWPHSSFMVPGGVVSMPTPVDLQRCRQLLAGVRAYYERAILGADLDRVASIRSAAELDAWLDEAAAHQAGELGFLLRFGRAVGIDRIGRGHGHFVSFGGQGDPTDPAGFAAGFVRGGALEPFDQAQVTEHVAASWFHDYPGGKHPLEGETRPYASGHEGKKYSWAKAPRYDGLPAETGPLADQLVRRDPLFVDLVARGGPSALVRALARLLEPALLLPAMDRWLAELARTTEPCCRRGVVVADGVGIGLTSASRGALGHWVRIEDGRIARYQIITPTAWNGSPRDADGVRGPWEEALVGTPVADPEDPVELGHVVRSYDPCQVCAVHVVHAGGAVARTRIG